MELNIYCSNPYRLNRLGSSINYYFVDNCSQWREELNTIFDSSSIKLDPFHAIQWFPSKSHKKGSKGSPIQKQRFQIVTDFNLVIRDPTDLGKKRNKPTHSKDILKNIDNFRKQWKDVEYNGIKLIPECAISEIKLSHSSMHMKPLRFHSNSNWTVPTRRSCLQGFAVHHQSCSWSGWLLGDCSLFVWQVFCLPMVEGR